jgi:hypothetical protein
MLLFFGILTSANFLLSQYVTGKNITLYVALNERWSHDILNVEFILAENESNPLLKLSEFCATYDLDFKLCNSMWNELKNQRPSLNDFELQFLQNTQTANWQPKTSRAAPLHARNEAQFLEAVTRSFSLPYQFISDKFDTFDRFRSIHPPLETAVDMRELKSSGSTQDNTEVRYILQRDYHNYETMYSLFLQPISRELEMRNKLNSDDHPLRERARIMEIGIGNGLSVLAWKSLFGENNLFLAVAELDARKAGQIATNSHYTGDHVHYLIGDQGNLSTLNAWIRESCTKANHNETEEVRCDADLAYDAIIDDGSHRSADLLGSFTVLFDRALRPGGVYFLEGELF